MPLISPHRCYVVIYMSGYSSMGTPDEMYYEGESDEDAARARAAAQAEADTRMAAHPTLHHAVYSLSEYIYEKTQEAQAEGERRAQRSDY